MDVKDVGRLPLGGPGAAAPAGGAGPAPAAPAAGQGSFATVLKDALQEVDQLQRKADAAITSFASGDKASLHDTMIAMEQADVSFRLMVQVRNKIVEAYQEIMRIQV
jgi:flagellar hook-basal body complex protein FliE